MSNEKVKHYEHGCEILQRDPAIRPNNSMLDHNDAKALDSLFDLMIITRAQKKLSGVVIDLDDSNQTKHFPVFVTEEKEEEGAGVGLSLFSVIYFDNYVVVGSRLSSGNREDARHIAETFKSKFEDWLIE